MAVMGAIAPAQRLMALAAELGLTEKQRLFCEILANDPERNQTHAAEGAGCGKGAHVTASKWLKLAKVKAYLAAIRTEATAVAQKRTGRYIMGAAEVLERLTEQAVVDLADFVTLAPETPSPTAAVVGEGGPQPATFEASKVEEEKRERGWYIDIPKALAAGLGHLIQEIGYDKQGLPKLKLPDRQGALDKLAKYHGHYKGDDGGAASTNVSVTLIQVVQRDPRLGADLMKALLAKPVEGKRVG